MLCCSTRGCTLTCLGSRPAARNPFKVMIIAELDPQADLITVSAGKSLCKILGSDEITGVSAMGFEHKSVTTLMTGSVDNFALGFLEFTTANSVDRN